MNKPITLVAVCIKKLQAKFCKCRHLPNIFGNMGTTAGNMVIAVALRLDRTPSLRPLLATLFFVEARPSTFVSSLATFLRLRCPQVVFRKCPNWTQLV
ncbi:hypothetical protein TNCV_3936481 [Trichonephila clavipes]|nr:hypothetical protein TNCV_3936481 [Trichonephila clavipes]